VSAPAPCAVPADDARDRACDGRPARDSSPAPVLGVAVVVPARDEQELIERCLASVAVARRRLAEERPEARVVVVVVADGCSDDTVRLARAVPGVAVLETSVHNVGLARSAGVEWALAELRTAGDGAAADAVPAARLWIANTDADSQVPPTWLTSQLDEADAGADVVVGTVRPDFADLSDEQIAAWTARHTPGRPNGHVHGANLGVRASRYADAGGFGDLDLHEDVSLVGRLRSAGATLLASEAGEVLTSGRRVGRTRGGYAGYLANDLLA
jgi:glycosyltransferase involved in cell wall biosynthesis